MVNETSPLIEDTDSQLYDEDGFSIYSENTKKRQWIKVKILYILGILIVLPLIWYVIFYLPNLVPPATKVPLNIVKVKQLPIYLHPLVPKSHSMLVENETDINDYNYLENGDSFIQQNDHQMEKKKLTRRLIMIGDIHGSYRELSKLMKKMQINHKKDYVLLLGDFISKGPDSSAVLNWAMANKVGCVLGNHEVYILNRYAQFHSLNKPEFLSNSTLNENDFTTQEFYDLDDEMKIAKNLKPDQVEYLLKCPLMYDLGPVDHTDKHQTTYKDKKPLNGVAVHAGLMWNLESLQDQDPETVVSIRYLLPPNFAIPAMDPHIDGAQKWTKRWNLHQKELAKSNVAQRKVFYGHNARKGLDLQEYSAGLDTGCVTGGKLTAVALWSEVVKNKLVFRESIHQVSCN